MTETTANKSFTLGSHHFRRPGFAALFLTVLLVGLCLALGAWQVQRLEWKRGLLTALDSSSSLPPLTGADLPANKDFTPLNFRKIRLEGVFLDDREFHLIGRYYQGALGYDVLTPFYVPETDQTLLVNRGWIPLEKKDPASRPEPLGAPGGTMLEGIVLVPGAANPFLPDHDVKGNIWFWYDIARMNAESGLDMPSVVIETVNPNARESVLPIPRKNYVITLRNDHLYYALTWFSLAFAGIVIFFLAHRIKTPHQPQ